MIAVVLLSAVLSGCGSSTLTRPEAARLIAAASMFQDDKYFDVRTTGGCGANPGWPQVVALGFAAIQTNEPNQCELKLTDAGLSEGTRWKFENGLWRIPTATRTFSSSR